MKGKLGIEEFLRPLHAIFDYVGDVVGVVGIEQHGLLKRLRQQFTRHGNGAHHHRSLNFQTFRERERKASLEESRYDRQLRQTVERGVHSRRQLWQEQNIPL